MKRVLFIVAIYTLIIHQCTKKDKLEITGKIDQQKLEALRNGKHPPISPVKKEVDQLNIPSSFVRNVE